MNLVRELRTRAGMQQKEIAIAVGVSRPTVSEWEHQKKDPSGERLIKLAQVFGVSTGVILGYDPIHGSAPRDQENLGANGAAVQRAVDYERAASMAVETLIKSRVTAAPVSPLHILTSTPGVLVVNFTEFADHSGLDRTTYAAMFGSDSQDAVTINKVVGGMASHYVAYNQRLPFYMLQLALARELGHIVLGHDNAKADEVQTAEALVYARHLLCPRPLVNALQEHGVNLTVEMLGSLTGCFGRSLAGIRQTPGSHVAANLNAKLRDQLMGYVDSVVGRLSAMSKEDDSGLADFGTYMDNYEE